ncbi:MAG: NAD(P)H-dependent oxidoreductase subunit E [Planctomycetota bacterium]|nr:NAD(P)H-dependent oxidoreductase subunit E [Planctomycetota bacterium]
MSSNEELLDRWRSEPAPLLPILHAFQDRDGYLSDEVLRDISQALSMPLAELFGTVTFYHFFHRHPPGKAAPRVCNGPICKFRGSDGLIDALASEGASAMPCAGRCDEPIPVLRADEVLLGTSPEELAAKPSLLPPANAAGNEECVFAFIREPGQRDLDGYRQRQGYLGLARSLKELSPGELLEELESSGLAGRGGAGFPTARKWRAVADADGDPKNIVCNADEGEPGCFKDRALMDWDPHAIIEGMAIAGRATGATQGFIYLRYEYPQTYSILSKALTEAEEAGFLGNDILGEEFTFNIHLRRAAGAYICGEETSLLNSLEGKHPFPRNRPPFPVTHGYEDKPTAVNNVETLASVPHIVRRGGAWYRGLGLGEHAGTKVVSLSGDIQRPGNYEVPMGLPLSTLLHEWAGGPLPGRTIQAVTMAGLSGGFLAADGLDVTLDEPSIRSKGSFLGAGGIMVFDDRRDMVAVAEGAMSFFAHESCGKCFPCRIGTQRLTERLSGDAGPAQFDDWAVEVRDIGETMAALSACGLGIAAPLITESLLRYFPEQVATHVASMSRQI